MWNYDKKKKIITDTKEIVQVLNDNYVIIVERSCGEKPASIAKQGHLTDDSTIWKQGYLTDDRVT